MTKCDEIIIVLDIVSTKKTTTVATNVPNTASINFPSKKVRLLHFVYSFIIHHITIDNYFYLLSLWKKNVQSKIENNKF